jgi:hypothetical protein
MFLIVLAAAILGGSLWATVIEPKESLPARLAIGIPIGVTVQALLGYLLAAVLGLTPLVAFLSSALVVALPLLVIRKNRAPAVPLPGKKRRKGEAAPARPSSWSLGLIVYFAVFALFFWQFFGRAAYTHDDGSLATGEENNFGDLGFHVGIINGFVKGENFPPEHPEMAGVRLTYPFLADFGIALLMVSGMSLTSALLCQNVALGLALVGVLYRWTLALTRDRAAALLAPVLVLLNGGLGFVIFFVEMKDSGAGLVESLQGLRHSYTVLWGSWGDLLRWGNSLTSLLITQRAFLLGLPLALVVWTLWWQAFEEEADARRRLWSAGFLTGLLPLTHAHSYMVLMPMAACLALLSWRRWRDWLGFFGPAVLLALPQIVWSTRGSGARAASFTGVLHGWMHQDSPGTSVAAFWAINLGLSLLGLAAFVWPSRHAWLPPRRRLFLVPFLLCLVGPNLMKLAPWEWDNIKVLLYGYLALVPPVALLLSRLGRGGLASRLVAAGAFAGLTLSGALDVWRVVSRQQDVVHFGPEAFAQAAMIEEHTPPRARILSAQSPSRATLLSGRRTVVGLPFHIWTHGMDAAGPSEDVKRMYAGGDEADALLRRYAVDYVLIGPPERTDLLANEAYFARFERVGEAGGATLYKVRQ